jgi:uncharacterized membrane-anchored protein
MCYSGGMTRKTYDLSEEMINQILEERQKGVTRKMLCENMD